MIFVFAGALLRVPAEALEKSDDIDTNRPSFMLSPLVVPRASVQLENGALYQHFQHGLNYFDLTETQVRVGLTKKTEFQMYVPNCSITHQEHTPLTRSGVSDLGEVGIKRQFGPIKNAQVAVTASLNLPTGSTTISGPGVQPVFRAPWTYPLNKNYAVGGMQSILVLNSGHDVQYQPDFLVSRSIGARASAFAEYVGFFTQGSQAQQIAHFGAVYKPARHHQVDMHFGFGLDKAAPAAFIGCGYSFRFDRFPRF
ncbi:MAG: transporter [Cyanobacteria bacterium REEB67]|nr:transporter [Cyanobacteria bacterium REEB67]